MTIEYWVNAEYGDDNSNGSKDHPKRTILGARSSQGVSDVDGGMKYRGGIVHLEGMFRRSFIPVPYPKNLIITNAGNVINEWCPADKSAWNTDYHSDENPLVFEADGVEKAIINAFRTDPEPGSDPSMWDIQGGPGISIRNKRNIRVNGHFNLEVWGGLPVSYFVESTSPSQPTDDVVIEEVIFRFVNPESFYAYSKEGGRRMWLRNCLVDPDGTGSELKELSDKRVVIGGMGPGLINGRIG